MKLIGIAALAGALTLACNDSSTMLLEPGRASFSNAADDSVEVVAMHDTATAVSDTMESQPPPGYTGEEVYPSSGRRQPPGRGRPGPTPMAYEGDGPWTCNQLYFNFLGQRDRFNENWYDYWYGVRTLDWSRIDNAKWGMRDSLSAMKMWSDMYRTKRCGQWLDH